MNKIADKIVFSLLSKIKHGKINLKKLDLWNAKLFIRAFLKLFVKMSNGFFQEELIRSLISLCGMYVEIEQTTFSDDVYLCIEGEATKEDIAQIANILIPNLEDLLICNPSWENGYRGLIQLIIMVHISNLLYRSSSSKNYV